MCEQGGVLTRGLLTHERRWSETILCLHAHAIPVIVRPTLYTRGWQQKKYLSVILWRTVTGATFDDETPED